MSEEQQIEVAGCPEVRLAFDAGSQSIQVGVKNVANLDFALAMLEMAKVNLTFQRNMAMVQAMEAQQQQANAMARQLNGRLPR